MTALLKRISKILKMMGKHALNGRGEVVIPACLSFLGAILLPGFVSDDTTAFSNSFVSILYASVLFLVFVRYYGQKHGKKEVVFTHIFGFLLSFMTAAGQAINQNGHFFPISLVAAIGILFYAHAFACLISFIWKKLSQKKAAALLQGTSSEAGDSRLRRLLHFAGDYPFLISLSLLLCWGPCYIAFFPGGFMYDVYAEFNQQYDTYLSCFPRIHSALMIGCLNAAHSLFGSYNAGIAVYCAVQMTVFSAVFTHMLVIFYRQRVNGVLLIALWLYFALFPVIHLIITSIGRDTLFAVCFTYLVVLLYWAACDKDSFMRSVRKPLLLGAVLALTVLSRNNANEFLIFLILAVIVAAVWLRLRKNYLRGITVFSVSCLAVYVSLSIVLSMVCSPMAKANPGAALGLITQTLTRAKIDEPEKWSDEDNADFERFVDAENLAYCPELADISRETMTEEAIRSDVSGFIKLWFRMGLKCPDTYLNAVAAQTRYSWYPDNVIDGYARGGIYDAEKSFFTTGVSIPGKKIHIWRWGEEFYRKLSWDISFEKIPVVSMLFSIGFHNWLVLNCFFYALYRRRRSLYLPLGTILVYLGICFFVPVVLIRYYMPVYLLFPLIVVMTLCPQSTSVEEKNVTEREKR